MLNGNCKVCKVVLANVAEKSVQYSCSIGNKDLVFVEGLQHTGQLSVIPDINLFKHVYTFSWFIVFGKEFGAFTTLTDHNESQGLFTHYSIFLLTYL